MELSTAIHLIKKGIPQSAKPERWVDLGAGDGLFTRALGSLLPLGSSIVAVDKDASSLKSIKWDIKPTSLKLLMGNFSLVNWGENIDGILMANSLHYIPNTLGFLERIKLKLAPKGRIVIVEYEHRQPNQWVPYPVDLKKLMEVGETAGFLVDKLEGVPSTYDNVMIYSAIMTFI